MKKLISFCLVAVVILTLSGCTMTEKTEIFSDGSVRLKTITAIDETELEKVKYALEDIFKELKTAETVRKELNNFGNIFEIKESAEETVEFFKKNSAVSVQDGKTLYTNEKNTEYKSLSEFNKAFFPDEDKNYTQGYSTKTEFWRWNDGGIGKDDYSIITEQYGINLTRSQYLTMPEKITKTNCQRQDEYTVKLTDKDINYVITEGSDALWTKQPNPENYLLNYIKSKLKPLKISGVAVNYFTARKIKISWNLQKNCDIYTVEKKTGNGKWKIIDYVIGENYTYDGFFLPNKTVYYRVRGEAYTSRFTVYGEYSDLKSIKTANLNVKPKITVSVGKKRFSVSSKERYKNLSGFEIKYSLNKKFKKAVSVFSKKLPKTIKNLKSGKTYRVKVRKYRLSDNNMIFSPFSSVVKIKVK